MARPFLAFGCFCLNALLLGSPAFAADVVSTWNGSGNWSDPARWNPAVPNNGAQTFDAIINGGTATLDLDVVIQALTFGGGTIAGDLDLELHGVSSWTGGIMSGSGQTTIGSGGTLSLTGGSLSRLLDNEGTTTWTTGAFYMTNGTFQNNGSFTANTGSTLTWYGNGGTTNVFNNAGTFTKQSGGTATFTVYSGPGVVFNNSGTVDVQAGTLKFESGGTHTGDFSIAAGSTLWLSGNQSFAATTDLSGSGTVNISGGTTTLNGQLSSGNALVISGGTVNLNSTTTAGSLTFTGGLLSGTGNVTFNGTSTWSGNTMSGTGTTTIGSSGTLSFTGGALNRTLVNEGTTTWTSNNSVMTNGTFQNNGSFTANTGSTLIWYGDGGTANVFNNVGTFTKQGGGTATFTVYSGPGVVFNNSGTVDVQAGTLKFESGGTHTGDFSIAAGSTLWLSGNQSFAGASHITGAGTVNFSGATVGGSGTVTLDAASTWSGGTMTGTGQTIIGSSGTFSYTGGSLNRQLVNDGTTTWTQNSIVMSGGTLQNNGSLSVNTTATLECYNFGAGTIGVFNNAGSFTKLGTGTVRFWNNNSSGMPFNNTGTVDVQAGNLRLEVSGTHTGDFTIAADSTLWLSGSHNFAGTTDIGGSGTVNLGGTIGGSGTVTLNGASVWSGATMAGTGQTIIGSGGTLSTTGGLLSRTLVNNGTATWTTSSIVMSGGTLQNNGSLSVNTAAPLECYGLGPGAGGVFNNAGTFTKLGTGLVRFWNNNSSGMPFNNTGTVNVQAGSLRLEVGGTHTGDFSVAAGSTLVLDGNQSFASTSHVTSAGTVNIVGGTTTFNGQLSSAGALVISSGTANLNSNTTAGSLTFTGGLLSGTGNVTFNGASTWTGNTMSGTGQTIIGSGGTLSTTGGLLSRTLVNNGTATWTTSNIVMSGGTFQNNGSLSVSTATTMECYGLGPGAGGVFDNAGTFTKLGTGLVRFWNNNSNGMPFNNTGTVNVQAGDLRLEVGGTHAGDFTGQAGATIEFNGNHTFAASSHFAGNTSVVNRGIMLWNGHTANFNGTFENRGTLTVAAGSTLGTSSGITNFNGAVLKGTGTVQSHLTNSGRLAPGNSPGIIHIEGAYTQTATGTLEIEVGGRNLDGIPGVDFDQVQVTGHAALGGQFEFPIINSFVPQLNDEITFLTANSISGAPSGVFAPNLGSVNPNLSFVVIKNSQDLRLRFVAPTDVHFVDNSGLTTQDWNQAAKWDTSSVPSTSDRVELTRSQAPSVDRVEVTTADAVAHAVSVHDQSSPITIAVENDKTLATAVGDITIGENATIELGTAGNPMDAGTLVTPSSGSVLLEDGGMLQGNGTVAAGELNVSNGTLSPGFSVGHVNLQGNYKQQTGGTLLIDVDGDSAGEFDTVNVSGAVELGGTLRIDATNLTMPAPGTTFEILAAGSLAEGEVFDSVETIGNDDIFFAPIYTTGTGPGSGSEGGSGGTFTPRVAVGVYNNGDMNRNGLIDNPDVQAFAIALTKPINYFSTYYLFGNESGDLNNDGRLDFDDIEGFASLISGTGATAGDIARAIERELNAVPEPSTVALLLIGFVGMLRYAALARRAGR